MPHISVIKVFNFLECVSVHAVLFLNMIEHLNVNYLASISDAPLPTDFVCETHDLVSAVCSWKEGRNTNLLGKRRTLYLVNER